MKRHMRFSACLSAIVGALVVVSNTWAVDFESFEFNDGAGTKLAGAANTANPGNLWAEDPGTSPSRMGASDIRNGSYNIVKQATTLVSNYLQIDDITSGTRYLVARMSGWDFYSNPGDPGEEFRLAFLNDNTGTSGATITAQMNIRRDPGGSGDIILVGSALGVGAADIACSHLLSNTQTNPFTLVLELNKTANSYKILYKNGTNPTQVLGLGAVAPTRGGNSIRMAVNGNFGNFSDDYPIDFFEVFSVDRIALTDTNPFTDLITLEVNRNDASMTLRNTSGATISGIESYSITSATGALNPAGWNPVATNITSSTNEELAASFTSPINLTNGQTLTLSMGAGAWLKSPFEDLQMVLNLTGGATRTVSVDFLLNGGVKFKNGDFDFNNTIDENDWLAFIGNAETNISSLSRARRYQLGDLDGDGFNSIADFVQFKTLYDAANGLGAFDAMLAGLTVPEPGSAVLLGSAALLLIGQRRRRNRANHSVDRDVMCRASHTEFASGVATMPRVVTLLSIVIAVAGLSATARQAQAVILEDFTFSDSNGTSLDAAENSVNSSNTWVLSGNSWDPSAVLDGSFRITKTSGMLANAHIDIANVTTGKVWLVAEIAGWNFTATPSSTSEEVRLTFLDNDNTPPSGSFITAQMNIVRSGGGLALTGASTTGGGTGFTNITGSYPLPLVQTDPFIMVLELDKNVDQYSVYYKDGNAAFASIGTPGSLGASTLNPGARDGNSIRFSSTGAFNDTGEFFDISRIYLTDTSPIVGPVEPTTLTLEVKSNGLVSILNSTDTAITFNSYRIVSPTNDLNFAGWNSLSDQEIDTIGGGIGQSWDEAGGSDDGKLAESFLLGSSTLAPDAFFPVGSAFKPGGAHESLIFQYHDTTTDTIVGGSVSFVVVAALDGDYNNDGVVNAADYVLWRKDPAGHGGNPGGYNTWRANFGNSSGGGNSLSTNTSVPEPAAGWLALVAAAAAALGRRRAVERYCATCAVYKKNANRKLLGRTDRMKESSNRNCH